MKKNFLIFLITSLLLLPYKANAVTKCEYITASNSMYATLPEDNSEAVGWITMYNLEYLDSYNSTLIKNWDQIKTQFLNTKRCPDYALISRKHVFSTLENHVFLSYEKNTLIGLAKQEGINDYYIIPSVYLEINNLTNELIEITDYKITDCETALFCEIKIVEMEDRIEAIEKQVNSLVILGKIDLKNTAESFLMENLNKAKDNIKKLKKEHEKLEKEETNSTKNDGDEEIDRTSIVGICSKPEYRKPMRFLGKVVNFLKIIVPILIIGFGAIDLFKAVIGSKNDEIKKALKSIAVRVVAGVIIFLIPGLVQFVMNMVNEWSAYKNSWCCCTECLLNSDCDIDSCSSNSCRIEGMNN